MYGATVRSGDYASKSVLFSSVYPMLGKCVHAGRSYVDSMSGLLCEYPILGKSAHAGRIYVDSMSGSLRWTSFGRQRLAIMKWEYKNNI